MHPALLLLLGTLSLSLNAAEFQAGVASISITPDYPIRLSGYAARKTESEGVRLPLFAKALALRQATGPTALILTVDNVGISRAIRNEIVEKIWKQHSIPSDRLVIFSSHTHSAPCLKGAIPNIFVAELPAEQQARVDRYTRETIDNVTRVATTALGNIEPARLFFSQGEVGFAKNRRTPGGPVDHSLPVLVIRAPSGKLRAVLANYACHCTTLQGSNNYIHGDWAGVAQQEIQSKNPGATALISIGCGADSNPMPRGEVEHVNRYGHDLAIEVQRLIASSLAELTESIEFRAKDFDLPYSPLPSRDEWEKRATVEGIVGYHAKRNLARLDRGEKLPIALPYRVQTWNFGSQLAMVFLPGEVVVDYSLALKREFDPRRLWVSGYANWVPCYIPSARILREGGYEAEESLWYYDHPTRLSADTESLVLRATRELLQLAAIPR